MGWKIGAPSLKLNNAGVKSKSCGDFGSIAREALQEREGHDPDIDRDRAELNRYDGFKTAAELQEYSRQHVDQLRDAKGRKLRSDAVVMCATVLKPPAAMMATLSHDKQICLLDDAFEAFVEIVGKENIKSRADHFDEQGGHTHIFWEPMTADGRLCAKEMHNIKFFGRVNRELPEALRAKGWDIEDCDMYDAAKKEYEEEKKKSEAGRSSFAYKAEAERAKRELEEQIDALKARAEALESAVSPEDLKAIKAKPAIGGVKLSKKDYEALHEAASSTLMYRDSAQRMSANISALQEQIEEERRASEKRKRSDFDSKKRQAELEQRNQFLEKRVLQLEGELRQARSKLDKMADFVQGRAGLWSKVVMALRGTIGDKLFLASMSKVTGVRYDKWEEYQTHLRMLESQTGAILEECGTPKKSAKGQQKEQQKEQEQER